MTKGEKISKAMKNIAKNKKTHFYVHLEGNRLFLTSASRNPIELKVDITPVWHFCKEIIKLLK